MEKMTLPNEWVKTYLTEVSQPKQYKTIAIKDLLEKGFSVYGANGIIGFYDQYTHSDATVLITCRGASCGNIHLSKPYSYINGNAMALDGICQDVIHRDFVLYALKSRGFRDIISGSAQPQITREGLTKCDLNLAPLAEQKEIVRIIESYLQLVDQIKSRLDALPKILEQFRQSVLASAVSACHKVEYQSIKVSKIIKDLDQGWSPKCVNSPAGLGKWGVIKTSSVQKMYFNYIENKELPENLIARSQLSLLKEDILITRAGPRSRCGVTCIVDNDYPNLMICDKVYRLRFDMDVVNPNFINYLFNSPQILEKIEEMKTGSSDSGMNLTQAKLKNLIIDLPLIAEQAKIVKRVENLFALADQIESKIKNAQERVNLLTQSILAKAFRGEFTAKWREDNPDLISGENSAEALLKRIEEVKKKSKKK